MKKEEDYLITLSAYQRGLVKTLKKMGFSWQYFTKYSKVGFSQVDVSRIKNNEDLIKHFFNDGKDQKRFEIISCLGL